MDRYRCKWVNWLLMVCGILFLISCQASEVPQGSRVTVKRVVSGQTLEVVSAQGQETVRLIGIDAPDFKQEPWGPKAQQLLEEWVKGQPVLIELDAQEKDTFERRLAYVWQGGVLINEKLVKSGYALAASRIPNTKYEQRLIYAQEWARIMGQGIWNPEQPMRQTPAEFRKRT